MPVDSNTITILPGCGSDIDEDGICDVNDNCPSVFNTDQTDDDGDDVGNVCDNCVNVSNHDQANSDNDDLGDTCDNCPYHDDPNQADADNDGIGDICECDTANLDGFVPVNFVNYSIVAGDWEDSGPGLAGDTNRDGVVDGMDVAQIAEHWLSSCGL